MSLVGTKESNKIIGSFTVFITENIHTRSVYGLFKLNYGKTLAATVLNMILVCQ